MTDVKVLASKGCKHCEHAYKLLTELQDEIKDLDVEKIDITEHPKILEEYQIMSTPGIVINGELVFEGGVTKEKLRKQLED